MSKTQLHKIGQSGGFLGRLLGPLLKTVLPLIGNRIVLISLRLTAAVSETRSFSKENLWIRNYNINNSNEVIEDIMKKVKCLENSGLLNAHSLTNFETQKYYQKEPKFNDVYSRNDLPKINDLTYF